MVAATIGSMGVTLFVALTPGVQHVFHLKNLHWHSWLIVIGGALFTVFVDEWVKSGIHAREDTRKHRDSLRRSFQELLTELHVVRDHVRMQI